MEASTRQPCPDHHAGHEHAGCLQLVFKAELVRFGPAIHPSQPTEKGVDGQLWMSEHQQGHCWNCNPCADPKG